MVECGGFSAAESVLAGFLTGSIDVVLRVPGTDPRFVVLDYKTNRVPTAADEPLTARHYTPAAMTTADIAGYRAKARPPVQIRRSETRSKAHVISL